MSKTKRINLRRNTAPPQYAITHCSECSVKARCRNSGGGYYCASCEHDADAYERIGEKAMLAHA